MNDKLAVIKSWLGSGSINIFGLPFAGKDTQAKLLSADLDAIIINGGSILRDPAMPEHIKDQMQTGELIHSDNYLSVILPHIDAKEHAGKPLILNSVGRKNGEEDSIIHSAKLSGHPIKAIIFLSISDHTVKRRRDELLHLNDRGLRADDNPETIEIRLREAHEKTMPVIKNYKKLIPVLEIDGSQHRREVHNDIVNSLYKLATNRASTLQ